MSKKYILTAAVCLLLAIAVIVGAVVAGKDEKVTDTYVSAQKRADDPYCLLVLGKDKLSGLCDVMMLVSLDTEKNRACVMQIPRDTYALYGDGAHRKLNAAAKILGSEEKLCDFLSQSLGVAIDGYVSLGLDAFRKVIDRVGGVEIELDSALDYNDPEQGLYIHLPKGRQVLDGEEAEMLVRFRSGYARGDLDRLDVQKAFMISLFKKLKESVNITNAYGLASDILPCLDTNVGATALLALGLEALKLDVADVSFLTMPGDDAVSPTSGASFYVMSAAITNRVLCEYFGKSGSEIDVNRVFLHSSYESFREIYERDGEFSVMLGEELE